MVIIVLVHAAYQLGVKLPVRVTTDREGIAGNCVHPPPLQQPRQLVTLHTVVSQMRK